MTALRSFLRGMASIFDVSGVLYRQRVDEILARSDTDAIRGDWEAVHRDLELAHQRVRRAMSDGTIGREAFDELSRAYTAKVESQTGRPRARARAKVVH